MKNPKILSIALVISVLLNVVILSVFAYKFYNNWFESTVLRTPFRSSLFNYSPKKEGLIYFVGDSHTEGFELNEYLDNPLARNRGIWGDLSTGVLKRIDSIAIRHPSKLFLMIGVNDIFTGADPKDIAGNVEKIMIRITALSPNTKVYIESVLPTDKPILHSNEPTYMAIKTLNNYYSILSTKYNAVFINLYPDFLQEKSLKQEYSYDGLHMNGKGYQKWAELLKPYLTTGTQTLSINPVKTAGKVKTLSKTTPLIIKHE